MPGKKSSMADIRAQREQAKRNRRGLLQLARVQDYDTAKKADEAMLAKYANHEPELFEHEKLSTEERKNFRMAGDASLSSFDVIQRRKAIEEEFKAHPMAQMVCEELWEASSSTFDVEEDFMEKS